MGRWVVRFVMTVSIVALGAQALAQAEPPPQFETVERYATIVTEGGSLAAIALRSVFATNWVYAEHGLYWSEDSGTAAYVRVWDLIATGARLEVVFESATAAGSVIVTRERVWSDDAPDALSPLRWTGVYVLAADRILSITRVLDADQRDALLREAVIGTWRIAGGAMRLDADGGYRYASSRTQLDSDPMDSGSYVIEGGAWRVESDDATRICQPGDVGVWLLYAVTPDGVEFVEVEEGCRTVGGRSSGPGTRLLAVRAQY